MKSRWVTLIVFASVGLLAFCYLRYNESVQAMEADSDFRTWSPSPAALKQALVAAAARDPEAATPHGKRQLFIQLFQNRFRQHFPSPMAVGLRISSKDDKLALLCPARLEPWNMDQLAYQAWRETKDVFGHPFKVDLFVTYIGAPSKKVGELRPSPSDPQKLHITYLPDVSSKVGRRLGTGPTLASRP